MPLPATHDLSPDVLEGREPADRRRWHVPPLVVGGGLAVVLVGGVGFLAAQDGTGAAVVDASGSMVLDEGTTSLAAIPHSTQEEGRDAVWTGSIQLDLPDGQLTGQAVMRFSWAGTVVDDVVVISHSWGELDVSFDSTRCTGPFAKSSYREPRETGGSLNLRCDDGSLFAATLHLERDEEATVDHPFRVFYTLEDGAYVPG